MTGRKKNGTIKLKKTAAARGKVRPNDLLKQLYKKGRILPASESFLRLVGIVECLKKETEEIPPKDGEIIWLILANICESARFEDDLKRVANFIESKKLYSHFGMCWTHALETYVENSSKKRRLECLLEALCKTSSSYMAVAENAGTAIHPNFFQELYNIARRVSAEIGEIDLEILTSLEMLHHTLSSNIPQEVVRQDIHEEIIENNSILLSTAQPPNNIADLNVIPTPKDILNSDAIFLRPNFLRQPYPDLETYKDVQFRLLLEDFMQPLRKGVSKLLNGQLIDRRIIPEVQIYNVITFEKVRNPPLVVPEREPFWWLYSVEFKPLVRVNWYTSRRLIHGSLVCLWDGASSFLVASVVNSHPNTLARGKLILAIETKDQLPSNFSAEVIIEPRAFFEPYRAVLQGLQNFSYETFPMMDCFLGFMNDRQTPKYLIAKLAPYTVFHIIKKDEFTVRDITSFENWPDFEQLGLDEKQYKALQVALTNRVALIQGPPGTGKTFLAIHILRTLLKNQHFWKEDDSKHQKQMQTVCRNRFDEHGKGWADSRTPVVIICFTNHALDQFLCEILKYTKKMIRIGGQSKSSHLDEYNLKEVKYDKRKYYDSNYSHFLYEIKKKREEIESCAMQLKLRSDQTLPMEIKELKDREIISPELYEVFKEAKNKGFRRRKKDNVLKWWLGWSNHGQLLKISRESKLNVFKKMAATAASAKEPEIREDFEEDTERPCIYNEDQIENGDDEDYSQELKLDRFHSIFERTPTASLQDKKDEHPFFNKSDSRIEQSLNAFAISSDLDDKEQSLSAFAKSQSKRMDFIRNQLLTIPHEIVDLNESIYPSNVIELPLIQRWMLFAEWKRKYHDIVYRDLCDTQREYENHIKEYNQLKANAYAALCRTVDVIGLTTTGAARNRLLLEALKAKIVIVEEAAEVLESHIVCSLTSDCQHLIMIGDHQQLRPAVNVHELATKYHLDVSLFERLIMGGVKPVRLGVQHRMQPEVARLIAPVIYKELENHSSVYDHPQVPGMQHNVFFYHHNYQEGNDGCSFFNTHEVHMALGLALYLIQQQNVAPQKITILATYKAQLHKFSHERQKLMNLVDDPNLESHILNDVRITVVDNFQGEENDVIILSLVRNNSCSSIGFLRTANRVCVALSRARNGLYILGNMHLLASSSPVWTHIKQVLMEHGQVGEELHVSCNVHRQFVRKVKSFKDFPRKPFCELKCGVQLYCGHSCQLDCHKSGSHSNPCEFLVEKFFSCGHKRDMPCSTKISKEKCHVPVPVVHESCLHSYDIPCSEAKKHIQKGKCSFPVPKRLDCGHFQEVLCSALPEQSLCKMEIEYSLPCSHVKKIPCGLSLDKRKELEGFCVQLTRKKLLCGHLKLVKCNEPISEVECGLLDERYTLQCGHRSQFICPGKPWGIFKVECELEIAFELPCGHTKKTVCSKRNSVGECFEKDVTRTLTCGHEVKTYCSNRSPKCDSMVNKMLLCNHIQSVPCSTSTEQRNCEEQVEVLHPICSHLQLVPCSVARSKIKLKSWKCIAEPLKMLNCGHEVRLPCAREVNDNIKCNTMINFTLPCHHMVTIPCNSTEEQSRIKCKITCGVPLDCGHTCSKKCHDSTNPHNSCKQTVSKQLGCGHFKEMPCFRNAFNEICFAPASVTRACGHVSNTTCGEISVVTDDICREKLDKRLPCGHVTLLECSRSTEDVICSRSIDFQLGCRHTVTAKCGLPLEKKLKLTCTHEELKMLPCGHNLFVRCGSKEAKKLPDRTFCKVQVEKTIPQCKHKVQTDCGKKVSRKDCTSMCEKQLKCGHKCLLPCREPCTAESCREKVKFDKIHLPCGHSLKGECSLRYAEQHIIDDKIQSASDCDSLCHKKLLCGHLCSSRCLVCRQNKFHSDCDQICQRTLVCGHRCESKCGKECPPCKERCGYRCSHQQCEERCGDGCTPCMELCEWKCPHFACNHYCYEYCNREPCDQPCQNILACGHLCNSLCGEICPPRCSLCYAVKLPNNKRKHSRYIYLECNHWVEVEKMDQWISHSYEKDKRLRRIRCPTCPTCKKPIQKSFRYGDRLKEFHEDLTILKFEFFEDDEHYFKEMRKMLTELPLNNFKEHKKIQPLLSKLEELSKTPLQYLSRDERWYKLYCIHLTYLLCCLTNDAEKTYVAIWDKHRKKEEFLLTKEATESLLMKIRVRYNYMEKHANLGRVYYHNMFRALQQDDLYRQYLVLKVIFDRVPEPIPILYKELTNVDSLFSKEEKWTDEETQCLVGWIEENSAFFNINLSNSVAKHIKLLEPADFNDENWFKCCACNSCFFSLRYFNCPECTGDSVEC